MSVYLTPKSPFFQYDFQYKKRRYTGSTGVKTRRAAEKVRDKIRGEVAAGTYVDGGPMSLDAAAGRWWTEVGQHKKSAKVLKHRLGIAVRLIGPATPIVDISTETVSRAIERRRGETYARGFDVPRKPCGAIAKKGKVVKAERYVLANDTVNSDIIKRLRPILNRAEKVWEVKGLKTINWGELALPEAQTDIVHFADPYQAAWLDACGPTEAFALELLLTYGWRFGELFFKPAAYLPDTPNGPSVAIRMRKNKPMLAPLRPVDARRIAARVGIAQAAELESIWIERDEDDQLVTVSYEAMQGRLRRAAGRAGVDHSRLIHSARHHVATDFLATTGDLAKTKDLLGHADIKSTLVYAHALDSGLRDAINFRNSPGAQSNEEEFIAPKTLRKR
jgi:hypothetical protein